MTKKPDCLENGLIKISDDVVSVLNVLTSIRALPLKLSVGDNVMLGSRFVICFGKLSCAFLLKKPSVSRSGGNATAPICPKKEGFRLTIPMG